MLPLGICQPAKNRVPLIRKFGLLAELESKLHSMPIKVPNNWGVKILGNLWNVFVQSLKLLTTIYMKLHPNTVLLQCSITLNYSTHTHIGLMHVRIY